jgi:hypothetical protein
VVRFQCTEVKETLELPSGQWFKIKWWRDPVMFVNPGASEPAVAVLEPTVETAVVAKTRPVGQGTMFAVGGLDGSSNLSSVERYDEGKDEWRVVASMGSKRRGAGVCVLGGRLYAVGGYDGSSIFSSVERYDEGKDEWRVVASMGSKRDGAGVCVLGGRLYAVGGHDGSSSLSSVERYDEGKDEWEVVAASMSSARSYVGVAVLPPASASTSSAPTSSSSSVPYEVISLDDDY